MKLSMPEETSSQVPWFAAEHGMFATHEGRHSMTDRWFLAGTWLWFWGPVVWGCQHLSSAALACPQPAQCSGSPLLHPVQQPLLPSPQLHQHSTLQLSGTSHPSKPDKNSMQRALRTHGNAICICTLLRLLGLGRGCGSSHLRLHLAPNGFILHDTQQGLWNDRPTCIRCLCS